MAQNEDSLNQNDSFMGRARERFKAAQDDEREIRKEAKIDLDFLAGDQWDPQLKLNREQQGRCAHVDNRLPTFVQQIANEARQNKTQIRFDPRKDGSKETAEVLEGLARAIQYDSDAEIAFETALEYSAGCGFGYYQIMPDYEDYDDGDPDRQVLKILPVFDPMSVYGVLYPACFGRDPLYAFITQDIPKEEYKELYPKTELVDLGFEEAFRRSGPDWIGTDTIRIAGYWYLDRQVTPQNKSGTKNRTQTKVKFCKINGIEVLPDTETEWLGYCIPIIPVLGKSIIRNGKAMVFSLIRQMRDTQKLLNFAQTRIAETLATSPISPYLVAEGQVAGYEKDWQNINTRLQAYVQYKQVDVGGKPAPPPTRNAIEPPIQAYSEFRAQLIDGLKSESGIFDASLGNKSNETSGIALTRRQQQSTNTNMHFMDNLERAFKKGGKILGDAIPKYYDWEGIIRILLDDETAKTVPINQAYAEGGVQKHHKLNVGKYDVAVSVGKAYNTRRLETTDMMGQIIQANPQLLTVLGDIYFANSDFAGANKLAERFKKMLPPQLQDAPEGQEIPPQAQAIIAQLQQQNQAIDAHAQQLGQALGQLQYEKQAKTQELQSKMDIERLHGEIQVAIAEINTKAQNERERIKLEFDLNSKLAVAANDSQAAREQRSHEAGMSAADAGHDAAMSDKQHSQAIEESEIGHQQAMEQQDQAGQQAMMQQQLVAQNKPNGQANA